MQLKEEKMSQTRHRLPILSIRNCRQIQAAKMPAAVEIKPRNRKCPVDAASGGKQMKRKRAHDRLWRAEAGTIDSRKWLGCRYGATGCGQTRNNGPSKQKHLYEVWFRPNNFYKPITSHDKGAKFKFCCKSCYKNEQRNVVTDALV